MSPEWMEYGYGGLFAGTFLAATIIPLPSEAILAGALGLRMDPIVAVSVATIGNTIGGLTNYGLGYLANNDKVLPRLGIQMERVQKWERRSNRWGYWLGLIAWLPIVGDPMLIALGFLKSRFWPLSLMVFIGKLARYFVIAWIYFMVAES